MHCAAVAFPTRLCYTASASPGREAEYRDGQGPGDALYTPRIIIDRSHSDMRPAACSRLARTAGLDQLAEAPAIARHKKRPNLLSWRWHPLLAWPEVVAN